MPLPYHLIDGYNVLHAAGLARATYGPGDLERARTGLLVRLADGLGESEKERTTVVFDAADPPPDGARSFRFRGMAVLFAVEEREADALIEELIRRHPSPRQLRIVSDDIRLQKAAKRRGAQAVKSDAFLDRLKRRGAPTDAVPRRDTAAADVTGGVGDWLEFFGMDAGAIAVGDGAARPPVGLASGPEVAGRPAAPALPAGPHAIRPRASQGQRNDAPPLPPADNEVGLNEDLAFWQRRIDELLNEERRRPGGG